MDDFRYTTTVQLHYIVTFHNNNRDVAISRSQAFVSQQLESIVDHTSQAVDLQISRQGLQMPSHTDMQRRLQALAPLLEVMSALNPESLAPVRLKYALLMHALLNKVCVWGGGCKALVCGVQNIGVWRVKQGAFVVFRECPILFEESSSL